MNGIQVCTINACPAVERAGLDGLNEDQKISYEIQDERGGQAAVNLKA
jgi:CspA family cold shock protein